MPSGEEKPSLYIKHVTGLDLFALTHLGVTFYDKVCILPVCCK